MENARPSIVVKITRRPEMPRRLPQDVDGAVLQGQPHRRRSYGRRRGSGTRRGREERDRQDDDGAHGHFSRIRSNLCGKKSTRADDFPGQRRNCRCAKLFRTKPAGVVSAAGTAGRDGRGHGRKDLDLQLSPHDRVRGEMPGSGKLEPESEGAQPLRERAAGGGRRGPLRGRKLPHSGEPSGRPAHHENPSAASGVGSGIRDALHRRAALLHWIARRLAGRRGGAIGEKGAQHAGGSPGRADRSGRGP